MGKFFDKHRSIRRVLPENAVIDVTPEIADEAYYHFSLYANKWSDWDIDVDSDNTDRITGAPARSEAEEVIEDDSSEPGKIILANRDDPDADGVPGFADGFGQNFGANTTRPFARLIVELHSPWGLKEGRITFSYSASDPNAMTFDGETYAPAAGKLRIWKRNGNQGRKPDQVSTGGDYVASGVPYSLEHFGAVGEHATLTLYVEGIEASSATGDARIVATFDPDGSGSEPIVGTPEEKAVRFSVIDTELVEATGPTVAVPQEAIQESHAAPWFPTVTATLSNPRPNEDGTRLIGDLVVSGTLRSKLSDLVPDEEGSIPSVKISLNGESIVTAAAAVSKEDPEDPQDLTRPYPFSATFSWSGEVDISTGDNWIRVEASDNVPGSDLTGSAEFTTTITAQPAFFPASGTPGPYQGWVYQAASTLLLGKSGEGELHPYFLRLKGPADVLDFILYWAGSRIVRGADGKIYVADPRGKPASQVAMSTRFVRLLANSPGAFKAGFIKGFVHQGVDTVVGTAQFVWNTDKTIGAYAILHFDIDSTWAADRVVKFDDDLTSARQAATALFNFAWAINQQEWATLEAAARLEFGEAWEKSEPLRLLCMVGIEAMREAAKLYESKSAFEKGEIQGRIALELAGLLIPATKAGTVSKVALLEQLRTLPFVQRYPGLLARLDTMLAGFNALPPFCFVAGTLVHTEAGLKAIEEVRAGDRVLAKDEYSGQQTYKPVLGTVVTHPDRLYHLKYRARQPHRHAERSSAQNGESGASDGDGDDDPDPGELICSGPHPFYVVSLGRFVPARELEPGHDFRLADGRTAILETVEIEEASEGELFITYNFEVADYHTYFVGQEGVWVHNTGPDPCNTVRTLLQTKLSEGKRFREAFVEAIKETRHATKEVKVADMFQTGSDHMLTKLHAGEISGVNAVDELPTYRDWIELTDEKYLRKTEVWNGSNIDPAKDLLQGHHIATKAFQNRLGELLNRTFDLDASPVKVLKGPEHVGNVPTALHRRMEAEGLGPGYMSGFDDPVELMQDMLDFYDSNYPECGSALRAWANKHGVPY